MEEEVKKYKMTENVGAIVEKIMHKSTRKIEGKIRDKDLQAAATLIGEPIFVSKGKNLGKNFEKNALLNFIDVRDRYMELLHEAISSLDKNNMFTDDLGHKPFMYDNRLMGFDEHIKYNYNVFYPYSEKYITECIGWRIENVLETYSYEDFDEDEGCRPNHVRVDEEMIWLAGTYTKQFMDVLQQKMEGLYELDEEYRLFEDEVNGIKIDEEEGEITFYAWDEEDDPQYYKWVLYVDSNDEEVYIE